MRPNIPTGSARRNLLPLLLLVLLLPVIASCRYGDSGEPTVTALGDLTLTNSISAGSGEQAIHLQLLEVIADERMPGGGECASRGHVTVRLGVRIGGAAQEEKIIGFSPCEDRYYHLIGSYAIRFFQLQPPPADPGTVPQSEYSLRVRVSRLSA
jgi:hypothetical protein